MKCMRPNVGKYHDYYDKLNAGKKDYSSEVKRLRDLYYFEQGSLKIDSILEIGSGTGNHTKHLIDLARYVCACDIDPEMHAIAKEKLKDKNVGFYGDVSESPKDQFPLCVMMWHILNYFPSIQVINHIFQNVNQRLEERGLFLFDAWNGVAVLRDLPRKVENVIEIDGQRIVHQLNSSTSLMEQRTVILNTVDVYENEKLIDGFTNAVSHHIWTPKTISDLLQINGFDIIRIAKVDNYNINATEGDWKIMFIARKSSK
jgi:SAM-dependent methyltransferase